MNKLFERVPLEGTSIFWDYGIRLEHNFKGYYHWHQCCECVLVHEGSGSVVLNQMTFQIRRGMFFFFQPYQLHQVYADVSFEHPYDRSIFYVDPYLVEELLRIFPGRRGRFEALWQDKSRTHAYDLAQGTEGMENVFHRYDKAHKSGRGEEGEELTVFFLELLNHLPDSAYAGNKALPQEEKRTVRYSERVMGWIEAHYRERISIDRLAEELHLSNNYISRIFREETGTSITDYLTARRLKQACRLLENTDMPVSQIADDIGYENPSYFIHLFKKVMGITPLRYRTKAKPLPGTL